MMNSREPQRGIKKQHEDVWDDEEEKEFARGDEEDLAAGRYLSLTMLPHEGWIQYVNVVEEKHASHPAVHKALRLFCEESARGKISSPVRRKIREALRPFLERTRQVPALKYEWDWFCGGEMRHSTKRSRNMPRPGPEAPPKLAEKLLRDLEEVKDNERRNMPISHRVVFNSPQDEEELYPTAGIVWHFVSYIHYCHMTRHPPRIKICGYCGTFFPDESQNYAARSCSTSCRVMSHRKR